MKIGNYLEFRFTNIKQRVVFSWFLFSIITCTFIASFYWFFFIILAPPYPNSFFHHFYAWQIRGFCCNSFFLAVLSVFRPKSLTKQMVLITFSILAGTIISQILLTMVLDVYGIFSHLYLGLSFRDTLMETNFVGEIFHSMCALSALYGIVFYFDWANAMEQNIHNEKVKRITTEQKAIESHLKALNAQIEPHFLFNTLANILNLLDTNLKKGMEMQNDLIRYLQSSLTKIRLDVSTLGQEMEMIQAYLNIFKIRMGDRLNYIINIPETLKDIEFPPMLIQPLVENAIKHGIDPKIEGGEISITTDETEDVLRLEVSDTGVGLQNSNNANIGLSNIQDRLKAIYGKNGRLILKENKPSGLKAIIEIVYS